MFSILRVRDRGAYAHMVSASDRNVTAILYFKSKEARTIGQILLQLRAVFLTAAAALLAANNCQAQTYYVFPGTTVYGAIGSQSTAQAWCEAALLLENSLIPNNPPLTIGRVTISGVNAPSGSGAPTGPSQSANCQFSFRGGAPGSAGGQGSQQSVAGANASPKDVGHPHSRPHSCVSDSECGDPINMSIGNKVQTVVDYQAPGPSALQFVRTYNSQPIASSAANFASGWTHNYAASIYNASSTAVSVTRPDGKTFAFNLVGGVWTSDADISDKLVQLLSGSTVIGWQYTNADDDSLETYDSQGNLSSIAYREGTTVSMAYATTAGAPTFPALLVSATDSFGRKLTFTYVHNFIQTMTDPNGGIYTYALGSNQVSLSSVAYPDTSSESYLYNESAYTGGQNLPNALTGVIDQSGIRYDSTWYGTAGAAIKTALAGTVGQYAMTNTLDATGRIQSIVLIDPLGASRGRSFVSTVGRNLVSTVSQPAASGSPAATKTYAYDSNGNVAQLTDYNGNVQCSVYDLTRNLETGRVEGMAPGSSCPTNISTYMPAAGSAERKILTQWHSIWHLPAGRAEPLKITTWTYNGDGGVYCAPATAKVGVNPIGVVCSRSEQATTDATGASGFSATASGSPRVWAYTYNSFGQVLTVDGPRTDVSDVTTYTYYTCATGAQCGQINTITNALGQVTTFLTYNGNGQPLTISDPNGIVTTLIYDARYRVTSRRVGTETTSYSYYPTGLLNVVTLPDGSTIQNFYDSAHRLIKIQDGISNYISYTLDAIGNRTEDSAYDPAGNLHRTHSRVFNAVNKLYQDINAANTAAVTTTFGYDGNGNQVSVAAPLSRNTSDQYDALNRLKQLIDPNAGITQFTYDANDNLATVKDPRNLTTTYTHNGGDVTQLVSPDTGTSSSTYDSGGNLKISTDARGALATYTYDALNRVTQAAYSDQTINFTYDTGTNAIGRLTGASDANHSLSWTYDGLGRVTAKGQTVGTIVQSVGYGYSSGDLVSQVTPSGQTVTYGYTNHRITSVSVNGTTILSGVTYDPFGPANAWTWGNATTTSRSFDQDGNPSQIITAGVTNGYTVDNASRITGISDSGLSSNSWTFGYDLLDRVNSGTSAIIEGYTYDANSNRLTTTGAVPSTETIAASSNQLSSTTGSIARTYSYDSAGNTLGYGSNSYTFNQRGRMSQATVSGSNTNYLYNALGQLIQKSATGGTTLLMYDEAGHILGEYTGTGALIQETIWMGDTPVATLQPNGAGISIYYVHTDHLGIPRKITRPSDNGLMWRWDSDPFGAAQPNQNPAGLGTFIYNLRFPGQYFQAETGLFYNYYRDYDPQTGRYIESDPIGLLGGINTYAYVNGNPISRVDPLGLWSITAGIYIGPGIEITYGSDNGRAFLTGRVGLGIGAGIGFDLNGKIPGPDVSESCRGGIVLGASVKGDLRSGPFDLGAELGAARNYTLSQSELVNEFNAQLQAPWAGVEAAISVGGQVTLYQGKH